MDANEGFFTLDGEVSDAFLPRERAERPSALSVSAAMSLAKGALEGVRVRIVGEVSEVSNKAGYKAVYFTIKDEGAALPCMMWVNRYRQSGVTLRVGQLVEVAGRFSLYAAKGRMNFDVSSVSLTGEGELRMRVAAIARKLTAEGLTSAARKRPLPELPQRIGLVTSPRGAAVHDVLRTLRRRYPLASVLLAGVPVEGVQAPAGLIRGLETVVAAGAQVVLVVRGGGSFEDLMPFNDEGVARAIAACPVPVVTGIGHEPDNSIADMVADHRASTPTAAAEAVSPGMDVLDNRVRSLGQRMHDSLARRIDRSELVLKRFADRPVLSDPMYLLGRWMQDVDTRCDRLGAAATSFLPRYQNQLDIGESHLANAASSLVPRYRAQVDFGESRFVNAANSLVPRYQAQLALAASRLNDLSPLIVIARGYAIARDGEGEIVKSVGQVSAGARLNVTVVDGFINCEVLSTAKREDETVSGGDVSGVW